MLVPAKKGNIDKKIEEILTLLGILLQTKNSSLAGSSIFTPIVVCARDHIKYSHSVIRPPHETLTIIIEGYLPHALDIHNIPKLKPV